MLGGAQQDPGELRTTELWEMGQGVVEIFVLGNIAEQLFERRQAQELASSNERTSSSWTMRRWQVGQASMELYFCTSTRS